MRENYRSNLSNKVPTVPSEGKALLLCVFFSFAILLFIPTQSIFASTTPSSVDIQTRTPTTNPLESQIESSSGVTENVSDPDWLADGPLSPAGGSEAVVSAPNTALPMDSWSQWEITDIQDLSAGTLQEIFGETQDFNFKMEIRVSFETGDVILTTTRFNGDEVIDERTDVLDFDQVASFYQRVVERIVEQWRRVVPVNEANGQPWTLTFDTGNLEPLALGRAILSIYRMSQEEFSFYWVARVFERELADSARKTHGSEAEPSEINGIGFIQKNGAGKHYQASKQEKKREENLEVLTLLLLSGNDAFSQLVTAKPFHAYEEKSKLLTALLLLLKGDGFAEIEVVGSLHAYLTVPQTSELGPNPVLLLSGTSEDVIQADDSSAQTNP